MRSRAAILHADLDAFYASVEQRDHPELRGRPVIVGGGVVLAASYEARAQGVRTAMGGAQARRLCPRAVVVPPRMAAYSQASRAVMAIFRDTSPLVEPLSIDEAFLDVSGLWRVDGPPRAIAERLRRRVTAEVGLPLSIGVARTKFLAKVASGVAKPDGLLVVEPDGEIEFLHPLDVRRLWGVGPVTADKLAARGVRTVGDVARVGSDSLVAMLGPAAGRHLFSLAHNRDPRPVETGRRRSSIGAQRALGSRGTSRDRLDAALLELVDRVTERMRKGDRVARTVVLRARDGDFSRFTRSRSLAEPTDVTPVLLDVARGLLDDAWPRLADRGATLIGISLTNLSPAGAVQLALDFDQRDRSALDGAVDRVNQRYGARSVERATLLGHTPGLTVPLLPD